MGFDYYHGGVFEFLGHAPYQRVDPDFVRNFDWRNRHGANDPQSPYYDDDTLGTGWLTSVKDQGKLGTCWAFSAVGVTESVANLFANNHLDFDLSEQDLISCSGWGNCNGGQDLKALVFVRDYGKVDEECFPYDTLDCSPDSCDNKCNQPSSLITIHDTVVVNEDIYDSVRLSLIKYGPLVMAYDQKATQPLSGHCVNLTGYRFDSVDSTLTWIIKNSWGSDDDWGINGFCELKLPSIWWAGGIETPIELDGDTLEVICQDLDNDHYYNWGIGPRPANCLCSDTADCNDNDPFVGGYDENYNCSCIFEMDSVTHHITSDTSWSDTMYVNYKIVVDSGVCFTISSFVAFAPEAMITVLAGGELIIDSAYLTKACPELWSGIEVLGSDTVQNFDEYFGKVNIKNNSVIEFAKMGISNYCTRCSYNMMLSGGIIHAEKSIFRNNERDIVLAPFKNEWMGNELPYAAVFEKCQFVTTNELYEFTVPKVHVEIKDVYEARFYGCTFKNESDYYFFPHVVRGTGISGIDAQFYLGKYCNTPQTIPCVDLDTCKFIGLEYGIKALNCHSVRTLYLQDIVFKNNLLAISLSGIYNLAILSNDIKCPRSVTNINPDRFTGGIFLEGCNDYHVENNYIYSEPDTSQFSTTHFHYGLGVKNSGPRNNEIYNNQFAKLKVGIYCIGENRDRDTLGLCLKCNEMYSNSNDFVVVAESNPPSGSYQGINKFQGNPNDSISESAPAGNIFSYFSSPADHEYLNNYNYFNAAEDILYVHHHVDEDLVKPLDSNYTRETIELKGWQDLEYVKDSACPSTIFGGGLKSYQDPRLTISEADNNISVLSSQLNLLVDGGSTEELNFDVMTSMPGEGLELRQQLLTNSPYLSDTVLKQAIYKEEVLPNAMIRDILKANPQSAKSDEILCTLDNRFEPMPDYMMDQIMEGKKVFGAKELLEADIQSWKLIRSKAKAELFREFLLDTNVVHPLDSVIAFLENEQDLQSKYDLTLAYWNNNDTLDAMLNLNGIPAQFALNARQQNDHELYETYFGMMKMMQDSSRSASNLDSGSVQILYNMMDSGNPDIDAHARGLLVEGGFYNYLETIVLTNIPKSSAPIHVPSQHSQYKSDEEKLRLFPNPANDFVIVYFDLKPFKDGAHVTLYDMQGKLIRKIKVDSNENQIVFDLEGLSNGFYLVSLYSGSILIDSKRLTIAEN